MGKEVLHIIDNMCLGGAQRIVSTLVEKNSEHALHSVRGTENSMGDLNDHTSTHSTSRYNIVSLIDCWKQVRKYDPEVIHCHLIKSKIIGVILKILSRKDFALVMHEHGHIWKGNSKYNTLLKYTSSVTDHHIAVSKHTEELLKEKAGISDEKIEVVYNFVDRDEYNKETLESFQSNLSIDIDDESFTVGYGGRLEERKGWKSVVSAAEENNDIQFLMSGSGTGEKKLNKKAEELDNLHYLGFLDDVKTLFSNIDCFVLPSHWDPSPMILYEVQSCGIPLICTDANSINELVEDKKNALTYPSRDIGQLSKLLIKVKGKQSLRTELARRGVSNSENYTFTEFQKSLEAVYSKLNVQYD